MWLQCRVCSALTACKPAAADKSWPIVDASACRKAALASDGLGPPLSPGIKFVLPMPKNLASLKHPPRKACFPD